MDLVSPRPDQEIKNAMMSRVAHIHGESATTYYKRVRDAWFLAGARSEEELWQNFKNGLPLEEIIKLEADGLLSHDLIKQRTRMIGRWDGVLKTMQEQTTAAMAVQIRNQRNLRTDQLEEPNHRFTCFRCGGTDHLARNCREELESSRDRQDGNSRGRRSTND